MEWLDHDLDQEYLDLVRRCALDGSLDYYIMIRLAHIYGSAKAQLFVA